MYNDSCTAHAHCRKPLKNYLCRIPACTALQEDKYRQHGFDLRRYERLQRDVRRYERYLRRATDQHVSVFPDEEKRDVGGTSGAQLMS